MVESQMRSKPGEEIQSGQQSWTPLKESPGCRSSRPGKQGLGPPELLCGKRQPGQVWKIKPRRQVDTRLQETSRENVP